MSSSNICLFQEATSPGRAAAAWELIALLDEKNRQKIPQVSTEQRDTQIAKRTMKCIATSLSFGPIFFEFGTIFPQNLGANNSLGSQVVFSPRDLEHDTSNGGTRFNASHLGDTSSCFGWLSPCIFKHALKCWEQHKGQQNWMRIVY